LSPADGTVVYVKEVEPREPVISIKQGLSASINDIVQQDLAWPRILVGVFMSPFNVHYNRSPLTGAVEFIAITRLARSTATWGPCTGARS
jgi:phosphatidylserine decarboxylase